MDFIFNGKWFAKPFVQSFFYIARVEYVLNMYIVFFQFESIKESQRDMVSSTLYEKCNVRDKVDYFIYSLFKHMNLSIRVIWQIIIIIIVINLSQMHDQKILIKASGAQELMVFRFNVPFFCLF